MNTRQYWLLGIDGGGTSCRARLCDAAGKVLGEGLSGSANVRLGLQHSYHSILAATGEALGQAGLAPSILAHTYAGLGLAGAVSEELKHSVVAYEHPFRGVVVETDATTACLGAHAGADGGILILGTGSCGVAKVGERFQSIGGWGFRASDQGSGARIGLQLVRYALQAYDGLLPETGLSRAVMRRFDNSPLELMEWVDQAKPRDFGSFVPQVVEYAAQQDALAEELLRANAHEVCVLLKRLNELGADKICLMGGVSGVMEPWLPEEMRAHLVRSKGDAMDGALLMAANLAMRSQ
ncbi:MAG: BadF/BadG/BcrA/BcrD ATPase family protein [Amphritea sp.]